MCLRDDNSKRSLKVVKQMLLDGICYLKETTGRLNETEKNKLFDHSQQWTSMYNERSSTRCIIYSMIMSPGFGRN